MPITDGFKPKPNDPVVLHKMLDRLLNEYDEDRVGSYPSLKIQKLKTARQILDAQRELQCKYVAALVVRLAVLEKALNKSRSAPHAPEREPHSVLIELLRALLRRNLPLAEATLILLVDWLRSTKPLNDYWYPVAGILQNLDYFRESHDFSSKLCRTTAALATKIKKDIGQKYGHKHLSRLEKLLGTPRRLPLCPGEAWSDAAIADLKKMPGGEQSAWLALLLHCQASPGGTPATSWLRKTEQLVKTVGAARLKQRVLAWFPLLDKPRTQRIEKWYKEFEPDPNLLIIGQHADMLKGLAWCCGLNEEKELARALTALALSAYRKIPAKGPREVKIGNACVTALGMMPGMEGVYQLALLKVKVKFGTAQKFIEKALNATAERVGIPRDELEEMAVPTYGLTAVGVCEEKIGDFSARLSISGRAGTELIWIKPDGKTQSGVPSAVKKSHADELKELQAAAKDIQRMLPAQSERLDNLFREQKTWPFDLWRERHLDHPLIGVLARRLIWDFTTVKQTTAGIFFNGALVDLDLRPLAKPAPGTSVQLWHPNGRDPAETAAWRSWLDAQQIQQPFKQAHREVYLLTDAERHTRTYSNRFAAHLLRQHQLNALCAARGWKNKLRLLVDSELPPATVYLPKWNLRAEFWIEGVGEDYGTDTNDAGVFLRLSTDQVRFYRMDAAQRLAHASGGGYHPGYGEQDAEPMPLDEIPPLVFSEVMRDVDLFVGVASVGNDPTWSDGGPQGQYRDYWQSYSFGDLNATAKTRKEVLQRIVPRLKIAGQCAFEEKFLVVRGSRRNYKIHIGSGNVLMAPNDQYLCIVPDRGRAASKSGDVFLPFEGDQTLTVILSEAFLLADDAKIKDQTIVRQISSK